MSADDELSGFTGGFMGAVGAIRCRNCGEAWLQECAPKICTRCGARLTDQPGEGFESTLRLMESLGRGNEIIQCRYCGFRFYRQWPLPECPRCKQPLERPAMPNGSVLSRLRQRTARFF